MASVLITTFEIFTRVSPNNSLERLTERSVGIVTDRPSDVYELFVGGGDASARRETERVPS
jgi:hypothetical protein